MSYYKGNQPGQTPGILPGPPPGGDYYWWEGGALWGAMVDYWHATGDTTWNDVTEFSLVFQAGAPGNSYMPTNWTLSLGNDDQGFWGMSAMLAAENNFQNPPATSPQWLALAQAVFNTQAAPDRRDNSCGGGLRWQIFPTNVGYDYKNAIANGIFFNLGARLARYTGNMTYATWAVETWDWMVGVGMMDDQYNVFDGGHTGVNCTDIFKAQYSYCAAVMMEGIAFMYNTVSSSLFSSPTDCERPHSHKTHHTDNGRRSDTMAGPPPNHRQHHDRLLLPERHRDRSLMRAPRPCPVQHRPALFQGLPPPLDGDHWPTRAYRQRPDCCHLEGQHGSRHQLMHR